MGITIRILGVSRSDCEIGARELELSFAVDGLYRMYDIVWNPEPLTGFQECMIHFHC
jgi:hypothetical protein